MAIAYKDYYAILGVPKDAASEAIKQAYRRLARQHHPDLHPEMKKAAAGEKFKEINEAYEVLSDPEKKARYDQIGPGWDAARAPEPPGSAPRGYSAGGPGPGFEGFSDFFESLFGARGPGSAAGAGPRGGPRRGQDIEAELPLCLEDAFRGGEKRFSIELPVLCPACGGSGRQARGFCPACAGAGEVSRPRNITTHLPKRARDGMRLRLRGQGAGAPDGGEPGDLFLRVRLRPHPLYKVSGGDLETTVTVTPWDAALGAEVLVPALDGPIRVRLAAGTHAGTRLRIAGQGLDQEGGSQGDLYAVVRIDNPQRTDGRMEKLYAELREAAK